MVYHLWGSTGGRMPFADTPPAPPDQESTAGQANKASLAVILSGEQNGYLTPCG